LRDVLELGGRHGADARDFIERPVVGVVCPQVPVGDCAGRARRIRIEHQHLVAHRLGGVSEHPAELAASEQAEPGSGRNHRRV
jgi:hypothetical protein